MHAIRRGYGSAMAETSTVTTSFWHPFADMGAVSRSELVIERGEGVYVFDADGKRYLDGTAALWYANLGHGREDVADAVREQMGRIAAYSTFGDFSNPPANALAARLAAHAPMDDAKVFLGSGGGFFLTLFRGNKPGLNHYCYAIRDFDPDRAEAKLKAAGLKVRRESGRIYFHDPDGIEVQVSGS